ncbi:unnamed protein product [marine sediment metagenome]|uniref:Uncharacterized protein n=1 Tax=marine sediment metagenome TaxID=412755 RepID=X1T6M3_9ZZZZ
MAKISLSMFKDLFEIKNATHKLSCSHVYCRNSRVDYCMDCIILKKMPNFRLKILVFGERNRKGHDDKKQIRYVDESRVKPNRGLNKYVNEIS